MRRALVLALFALAALPASSGATKAPPLPCDYWVHGCNVLEYVCDTDVCAAIALPDIPPTKR